jgi:hypothetical protein
MPPARASTNNGPGRLDIDPARSKGLLLDTEQGEVKLVRPKVLSLGDVG